MAQRREALVCLWVLGFILFSSCSSFHVEKSPARVLISEDRSVEDGYMVEIEANGETRQLQLTPMESIWSDTAQSMTVSINENGEEIYEVKNIPDNFKVYHDSDIGSVLSLEGGKLNGILDSDYMIQSDEEGKHFLMRSNKKMFDEFDAVKIPETLPNMIYERIPIQRNFSAPIPVMNRAEYRQTVATYTPEIAVIVDSTLANLIGTADSAVYTYLTIFWNSVMKRFKTIESPKIVIKLTATVIMRNTTIEPFITNYLNGSKVYGYKALYAVGNWVYSRLSTLPPHDIFYLQTGRDMIDDLGNSGLGGIAFVGAACVKNGANISYAVGMGEDIGAYYDGFLTAAHEIAHNLGSPHDGDTASGTGSCPWADSYIMSYLVNSPNHLFFSNCSKTKMATYLASTSAACVKVNITTTTPPGVYTSTNLPGNVLNMTQQCVKICGVSNAVVDTAYNESIHCYNLRCKFQDPNFIYFVTTNRPAAENSPCPSGKRCSNAYCV